MTAQLHVLVRASPARVRARVRPLQVDGTLKHATHLGGGPYTPTLYLSPEPCPPPLPIPRPLARQRDPFSFPRLLHPSPSRALRAGRSRVGAAEQTGAAPALPLPDALAPNGACRVTPV